jgi:glucan phosphoethanolaminetransferase (alkaline phosphatase superfamily)
MKRLLPIVAIGLILISFFIENTLSYKIGLNSWLCILAALLIIVSTFISHSEKTYYILEKMIDGKKERIEMTSKTCSTLHVEEKWNIYIRIGCLLCIVVEILISLLR